jgi:hypothetical protein
MDSKRVLLLLTKYQRNTCSEQELKELEHWYSQLNLDNPPIAESAEAAFSAEMLSLIHI